LGCVERVGEIGNVFFYKVIEEKIPL